jgi:hypothetical protein
MPCPSHPPSLDHSDYILEEYKLLSSSLCTVLQPSIISSLFGPNILLRILFWNTFNLLLKFQSSQLVYNLNYLYISRD